MAKRAPLDDFENLSVPEKILRLQDLWDQVANEAVEVEPTEAQLTELKRRYDDMLAHPERGIPWEVVKSQLSTELKDRGDRD